MRKIKKTAASIVLSAFLAVAGIANVNVVYDVHAESVELSEVPDYTGDSYTVINDNVPDFSEKDFTTESYETYGKMDALGRCSSAIANIGTDIMPNKERESIGKVKPSGWHTVKYDCVDGKYLYNRCHLIGYQLTAENANEKNLITGTRYLNVEGMLPFENMVADYVKETDNHVLYRVTPVYEGDDLVATGVQMEAQSVEDEGDGIQFNVFCYNVQPGVEIDYATGDSWQSEGSSAGGEEKQAAAMDETFIININSDKFHRPNCHSVKRMKESNKQEFTGTREDLIAQGYEPCKNCNP